MAEGSGFGAWDILLYVLTGRPPKLTGWRVEYSEPVRASQLRPSLRVSSPVATVVFDGPPTHEDLRRLHGELRTAWEDHSEADANRAIEERVIAELAREMGGLRYSKAFFIEVCRRLISEGVLPNDVDLEREAMRAKQRAWDRRNPKH